MRSEGVKRPNVAPYDGAGVFTKVGLSRRATALAVADVTKQILLKHQRVYIKLKSHTCAIFQIL